MPRLIWSPAALQDVAWNRNSANGSSRSAAAHISLCIAMSDERSSFWLSGMPVKRDTEEVGRGEVPRENATMPRMAEEFGFAREDVPDEPGIAHVTISLDDLPTLGQHSE